MVGKSKRKTGNFETVEELEQAVVDMYNAGRKNREVVAVTGVTLPTIHRIRKRRAAALAKTALARDAAIQLAEQRAKKTNVYRLDQQWPAADLSHLPDDRDPG